MKTKTTTPGEPERNRYRNSSRDRLADMAWLFPGENLDGFDPASIGWVNELIGITARDGVQSALDEGHFVINVADEINNQAQVKIAVEPGSGQVLGCLNDISQLIHEVLQQGDRKVVVHCAMGMERSVLAVVWYLNQVEDRSIDDAYELVRAVRPIALDRREWINS